MSTFKFLSGVVGGIGLVALAPVFGAVGAITATGVLVGGSIGAFAGGVANEYDKEEKENIRKDSFNAGGSATEEKLKKDFHEVLKNIKKRDQFLIAITAIGIALANVDGKISKEELLELKTFSGEIEKNSTIPENTKEIIRDIMQKKPNFETAIDFVKKINKVDHHLITDMLEIIAYADGHVCDAEKNFISKWNGFVKANG